MKNLICLMFLAMAFTPAIHAQDVELLAPQAEEGFFVPDRNAPLHHSAGSLRAESAQQLVQRNAAMRAAERHERMAINARFGYSPSRPPSSTVPFMGSPTGPPTAYRAYGIYPGFIFPRPFSRF